jgi:hypothetical protein
MLAEVVLTPSESKRLIGKAVACMEVVKEALKSGLIVITKGTTNSYVAEEILEEPIEKGKYGRGIIVPGMLSVLDEEPIPDVIIEKGKVRKDLSLEEAVKMLNAGDVFVKGANALDPDGMTGVFLARIPITEGGTVGRFLGTVVGRGVNFIIPVSLEKLIPVPIREVVNQLNDKEVNLAMGLTVNVMPTMGKVVTEIEAFKILTGVEAINMGAGGVGGAEGARIFLLKGDEETVKKAFNLAQSIKGEPPFKPAFYWQV